MAIKLSDVVKPVLPSEEVLIKELGNEPVRVHCLLQRDIDPITDEAKALGVRWDVVLFHKAVKDEDGNPILSVAEWEIFQASNRRAYAKLSKAIAKLNGLDGEENEKN